MWFLWFLSLAPLRRGGPPAFWWRANSIFSHPRFFFLRFAFYGRQRRFWSEQPKEPTTNDTTTTIFCLFKLFFSLVFTLHDPYLCSVISCFLPHSWVVFRRRSSIALIDKDDGQDFDHPWLSPSHQSPVLPIPAAQPCNFSFECRVQKFLLLLLFRTRQTFFMTSSDRRTDLSS